MKRIFLSVSLFIILGWVIGLRGQSFVRAHGSGPPYVVVNGTYILGNPLLNVTLPVEFQVGADLATESSYLVGQPITFDVDERYFPSPFAQAQNPFGLPVQNSGEIPKPSFRWDFQDGSSPKEGKTVTHVFGKPGTYIVDLAAKYEGKTQDFASVDTIQLSVYPNSSYKPVTPIIMVDGVGIENPLRDTVSIKPATPISFDVSVTHDSIKEYIWDFGDEKGARGKNVKHRYARDGYFPVVAVRVIDEHNIFVDAYALLDMPFERPNIFLRLWYMVSDFVGGILYKE
jgi:PKD repeat protein